MSDQKIKAISTATSLMYDSDPTHNAVDCNYRILPNPVELTIFRDEIKTACKDVNYAPFNVNGTGNEGYLFDLPNDLVTLFATAARDANPSIDLSFLDDIAGRSADTGIPGLNTGGIIMDTEEMNFELNMILFGPPGTGKTYNTKKYAVAICERKKLSDYDTVPYNNIETKYVAFVASKRIAFTTFHQSCGYEDFIEGIKPITEKNTGQVKYPVIPGVFNAFCEEAMKPEVEGQPCVFIIDEINRGNISKIFGELITLIEPTKRIGADEAMVVELPYSKRLFGVPNNVYILGTMNTADRSIAMMDTALRRRFNFVEMMPDTSVLTKNGADKVTFNGKDLDIVAMLNKINERIEVLYDREHTIGHAFFTSLTGTNATLHNLRVIFENKVMPLLQEYFYEDYNKIQLVLGDTQKTDDRFKFVVSEDNKTKSIFKGNVDDSNIPEIKYKINKEAFKFIESYIEII